MILRDTSKKQNVYYLRLFALLFSSAMMLFGASRRMKLTDLLLAAVISPA